MMNVFCFMVHADGEMMQITAIEDAIEGFMRDLIAKPYYPGVGYICTEYRNYFCQHE